MAQFSALAMLIAARIILVLLVITRYMSSFLNASLGVTSYKKGASKVPIIGRPLEFIFGSVIMNILKKKVSGFGSILYELETPENELSFSTPQERCYVLSDE